MTKAERLKRDAVNHWEENLEILILNYLADDNLTDDISISCCDCPFCQEYREGYNGLGEEDDCLYCPIRIATGRRYCSGSPYIKVYKWFDCSPFNDGYEVSFEKGLKAIMEEIDFLKSL